MKRAQLQILLHGLVVLLVGLLCGVPYGRAITHDWGEEAVRAWRVAHFGLVVGGIWLMVVASVSNLLVLTTRTSALLVYSAVTSAYGFTVALVVAAIAGVRGLELAGPALNIIAFLANSVAAVASLVSVGVMLFGTLVALRQARTLEEHR
jgi:hypothetical protein